jgi:SnoaL-like domain
MSIFWVTAGMARCNSDSRATGCSKRRKRGAVVQTGVFHDDLVRTAQGWRIAHRRLEIHYVDVFVTNSDLYVKDGLQT